MSFFITHRYGKTERDPALSAFPKLLDELGDNSSDREHNLVSVTHESEWTISASPAGHVIFENVEEGEPSHLRNVPQDKLLDLWTKLAAGKIAELNAEPWVKGYG